MAKTSIAGQAGSFFRRLTAAQIAIIAGVLIVVVVGIILVISSASKKNMGVLFNSLDPQDASRIVDNLTEKQIPYELKDNGQTILIEKDKIYETRLALAGEGLPQTSVVGYEVFDRTNLGMSEFVQRLNYRRALEGELARTIGSMQEVGKVRVHLVIPEKALFEKDQKLPTASVILSMASGRSLSRLNIEGIQNLVASSIEGMSPKDVTVVDQRGKILNEDKPDGSSVAGVTNSQHEQQIKLEQYLAEKVQTMLDGVLGPANAEVRVNTELDFTQKEMTRTDFDPDRQVERSSQTIEESNESNDSLIVSNPGTPIESIVPYTNQKKSNSNVISNYEISKTVEHIIHGVGSVKRLSVAVMVNGTYKVQDKNGEKILQYIPRTEEEMQKLNEIVKNTIGYDPNRNDQISVLNVPFDARYDETELDSLREVPWWKNPDLQKLLLLLLAMLLAVFIMWRLLRSNEINDKLRLAYSLPDKQMLFDGRDEELGEIELVDDGMLLLPPELPEQLLLDGDLDSGGEGIQEELGEGMPSKQALIDKAKAKLDESPELTESVLMKMEIRNKVKNYLNQDTDEAIKLVRLFISQDNDDKPTRSA